jgi:CSLREA domain-containing protein
MTLFLVLSLQPIQQARAAALVVNTTADIDDGECINDCSLRDAINVSNASGGVADDITFNIPATGTQVIALNSPLPTITDAVTIDGRTNNGETANCTSGPLLIVLDGSGAGAGANGLTITSGGTVIQGLAIGNFSGNGIDISNNGSNTLDCNFIGTNETGITAAGNGGAGVLISGSPTNTIGGPSGNVISGNAGAGIHVINSTGTFISANKIGTDVTGTSARANATGISLSNSTGTSIGTLAGNVISGNTGDGIYVAAGSQADIQNNQIGTDFSGNNNLHNTGNGIRIDTSNGSNISNNTIKFNQAAGIAVIGATATGNLITSNQIASSTGLGIDLGADGITTNDAGDIDNGPNGLQNFPVITTASPNEVVGTLNSTAGGTFQIDIYLVGACDASGHGEGDTLVGTSTISLDGTGNGNFTVSVGGLSAGQIVTATATNTNTNNTSEFSSCAPVTTFPIYTSVPDAAPDPASTIALTATVGIPVDTAPPIVVTNTGTADLNISVALTNTTDFTLVSPANPPPITPGNSSNIVIRCNATTQGSFTTDVSVTHNDLNYPTNPAVYTVTCDVNPVSGPQYFTTALSPFDFGPVPLGGIGDYQFTIDNTGGAALTIDISISNTADFRWQSPLLSPTSPQLTIGSGNSTTITLRCVPQQLGLRTGTLTFTTNDPLNPTVTYDLQCNGTSGTITLTPTTLPNATIGQAYSQTLTPSAGTAPFTYTLVGEPPWLTIDNTGTLSGTPTATGTFTFTVDVADSAANTGAQTYSLTVDSAAVPGYTSTPPDGSTLTITTVAGTPGTATVVIGENGTADLTVTGYSITGAPELSVAGTTAPFTITDNSGTTQTLTVTCSSPTPNTYTGTLTVQHNAGPDASYPISCTVNGGTLTITPLTLPSGVVNMAYNMPVPFSSNGTAPFTFSVANPANLPPGISLNTTTNKLEGTPTTTGNYTFTINVVDANSNTGSRTYTLAITAAVPTVAPGTPVYNSTPAPNGTINVLTSIGLIGSSSLVISNAGTANLSITSYAITSGAPVLSVTGSSSPITISSGNSTTLTVQCSSVAAGTFNGLLRVNHNASGTPAVYNITCNVTTTPVTATPAVTVTPGPSPTPTPSLAGLCADLTGQTNPVVRAEIPPGAVPGGSVYCRVLAQDGQFKEGVSGERIGNQAVLNLGVIHAVDVYGLLPDGISAPDFNAPVTVCLLGTGSLVYLNALNAPRPPVILTNASSSGGYTCGSIPDAGTVVLVQNGGNLPGASFPGAGGDFQGSRRTLNGCQIVTLIRLKLRSVPGLDGAQLGIVEANVTLTATARTSRWYRVNYNGKSAWIFAGYVRPVGTCGQ